MSSTRYWHEEKFSERKVSEMTNYAFVLDANNKQLAPTKEQKAWFLIRKKRAILVSKYPMLRQIMFWELSIGIWLNTLLEMAKLTKDM